ncbi:MAG TPA: MFS transporter [Candidatus Baltobacteraceae bacterium]|nr:MFS transporter [Candidatus Baltobacteraceae bacterium]
MQTDVPQRLDRLPWSRWHWMVVVALGITWILDGLEVTVVGAIGPRLQQSAGLGLSATQIGESATAYLAGAVGGALLFGNLTDRFGRKQMFLVTLLWYLTFTLLTATSWNFASFVVFRALAGMGIGGEYAAINSAIDELIPSRNRGWIDLSINGSWWLGTIIGSLASLVLLDTHVVAAAVGWRLTFLLGAVLALAVLFVRRALPESPRWLMLRGRHEEAQLVVAQIEREVSATTGAALEPVGARTSFDPLRVRMGFRATAQTMFRRYPKRTVVALSLMIAQAFLYNAIFFTEALVLTTFFGVPPASVGLYILPFALGNLAGPILLGRLFDTIGRKAMISATYALSGILLTATGLAFVHGMLDAATLTLAWCVVFFFASAGASSAYLTVSETFPLQIRALAIAVVYAIGTLVGGAAAPTLFGALIATKSADAVFHGYLVGAAAMIAAALVELLMGVEASGRLLEDVAPING